MGFKTKKPAWLKRELPVGPGYEKVRNLLSTARLTTVCQEANCPNMWECFSNQTATFMILGSQCSRNCRFCNITTSGELPPPDPDEPERVAVAAEKLGLNYVVVTSVTRDDLEDGGAGHFAKTIAELKKIGTRVEVLIPDFQGDANALNTVIQAGPDVLNHNIETVPSMYAAARPQADYHQSLELLYRASLMGIPVKSGIMVGLGETREELEATILDLYCYGCSFLTIGQYLQPSRQHLPVAAYYSPEAFDSLKRFARATGFKKIASGPFVRSSYQAGTFLDD
ncbi:MAG TPA: lipoyl synthase [Desulfobacteraceae bacterium]|nr:lipoyl synthase [Desulfobacteraceae bacterium]